MMKKDRKDITGTNCIKSADGNIMIDSVQVAERWKEYYQTLLNEENENQFEEVDKVLGPI